MPEDISGLLLRKADKYQKIQNYLVEQCSQLGFTKLEISLTMPEKTISRMHDVVLQKIESKYKSIILA